MKAGFIAAFGFAATVAAQWGNIASCERTCRDNMVGAEKSNELGCDTGDLACLCTKQDFIYGLRDCSRAICNEDQAADLLQAGLRVCREAGVEITTNGNGGQGTGASGSAEETVSTIYSTLTTDGSTITTAVGTTIIGGAGGRVIVNTETESGGSVVLSTTTVGATESQESGASSGASETGSETGSGSESGSASEGSSETGSASRSEATSGASATTSESNATETASNESGTATESSGNADETGSTTTSGNAGVPQMTAAPAGVLAAAGLAILLL